MATTQIKFCGINDVPALEAAIAARADHVGFVFFEKSPRHLTLRMAAALADRALDRVSRVGLFVDADDRTIGDAVGAAKLDALQLHAAETPERAAELRNRFGLPVWKAIPVASGADIARANGYVGAANLVLFDAKGAKGALPGGTGTRFDWSLLSNWRGDLAWGLAGGIGPKNVADAIAETNAPLVDVSSGIESAPGVKDPALMTAFAAAVRAA